MKIAGLLALMILVAGCYSTASSRQLIGVYGGSMPHFGFDLDLKRDGTYDLSWSYFHEMTGETKGSESGTWTREGEEVVFTSTWSSRSDLGRYVDGRYRIAARRLEPLEHSGPVVFTKRPNQPVETTPVSAPH